MQSLSSERPTVRLANAGFPSPLGLLQWVYVGRVLVALAVFLAAAFSFRALAPEVLLTLAVAAVASLLVSGASPPGAASPSCTTTPSSPTSCPPLSS